MTRTETEAFFAERETVRQQVETLAKWIDEQERKSNTANWGHVGNLIHVSENLQEIIDFLRLPNTLDQGQRKVTNRVFRSVLTEGIDDGI